MRTRAKVKREEKCKEWHRLDYMEKAAWEQGKPLCCRAWGQSGSKGRTGSDRADLQASHPDKLTKAHLASSAIPSSTTPAANQQLLLHKLFLGWVLNSASGAIKPSGSGLRSKYLKARAARNCLRVNQKTETRPWRARGLPLLPGACFFSSMVHISTRIPGGKSCSAT